MVEVGKKYNYRTLYRMRKFFEIFSSEKLTALLSKLSWTYFSEVLSLKNKDEILYYLNECINKALTTRQLHKLIKSNEYNRLSDDAKNKLMNNHKMDLPDIITNPIIIKVDNQIEKLNEYALKELILNNLDEFLL